MAAACAEKCWVNAVANDFCAAALALPADSAEAAQDACTAATQQDKQQTSGASCSPAAGEHGPCGSGCSGGDPGTDTGAEDEQAAVAAALIEQLTVADQQPVWSVDERDGGPMQQQMGSTTQRHGKSKTDKAAAAAEIEALKAERARQAEEEAVAKAAAEAEER